MLKSQVLMNNNQQKHLRFREGRCIIKILKRKEDAYVILRKSI